MDEVVITIEAGYRRVLTILEKQGYRVRAVFPINFSRYIIVQGKPENILITFKTDVFRSFGVMFKHFRSHCVGDSINCEDLKKSIQFNVTKIYTIFSNGCVYSIPINKFLIYSEKWVNNEGKEVRSIPIRLYKKEFQL